MTVKTRILKTSCTDPWWNLAVEEYMLDRLPEGQCMLYLWQNSNTVVIGKNQNPWQECRTELLENEGGKLARRLSGGGAVFHDLGNLNFTFLVNREAYDLERQLGVIIDAVRLLGINAEASGRNDITADGRKFSGNAFCFRRKNAYHHGTILVSADMEKLSRYLQVSQDKIVSKGIQSVKSRVVNLSEYVPGLSIKDASEAMVEAFNERFGGQADILDDTKWMDQEVLKTLHEKYSSWDWRYGEAPRFDLELSTRFAWGGIQIGLNIERSVIKKAAVYSDAMDEELIGRIPDLLEGCPLNSRALSERLLEYKDTAERAGMLCDISEWLLTKGY